MPVPVVAIFDVGKTNKKLFLFDESYHIVYEKSEHFDEIADEDGDPCEDVGKLRTFIREGLEAANSLSEYTIRAVNFCSYGASFVHVDKTGKNIGYLYNYLKPYPSSLQEQFYRKYGGADVFSFQTASPMLGSLNSGLQLYRLRHEKPELFQQIKYSLHLPQYLSYLVTGKAFAEITSIGCHTGLWHFRNNAYHHWVKDEGILEKFPDLVPSDMVVQPNGHKHSTGIGLHDSSSALIPYLVSFHEPFALISTGTWSISLNPFNPTPLTRQELACDCLCYLQYKGTPVKASRLFLGHFHDVEAERIANHFGQKKERYFSLKYDEQIAQTIDRTFDRNADVQAVLKEPRFASRDLSHFTDDVAAYYQLVFDLVVQQYTSTQLILRGSTVSKIFVDGGFGNNTVYMNLLAGFFPEMEVYASSVPQATAIGAALAIHDAWNAEDVPENIVELKRYW